MNHQFAAPLQRDLLSVAHTHLVLLVAETVSVGEGSVFGIRFYNQMHFAELACTTRLFLMAVVGACGFGDSLAVGDSGLFKNDGEFVVVLYAPFESAEVEFALTFEDGLFELFRHLHFPCGILLMHACKDGRKFFGIALCNGTYGAGIFWCGIFDEIELHVAPFLVEGVAGAYILELDGGTYIAGAKFVDLSLDLAANTEYLGQALAAAAGHVVEIHTGGECA